MPEPVFSNAVSVLFLQKTPLSIGAHNHGNGDVHSPLASLYVSTGNAALTATLPASANGITVYFKNLATGALTIASTNIYARGTISNNSITVPPGAKYCRNGHQLSTLQYIFMQPILPIVSLFVDSYWYTLLPMVRFTEAASLSADSQET